MIDEKRPHEEEFRKKFFSEMFKKGKLLNEKRPQWEELKDKFYAELLRVLIEEGGFKRMQIESLTQIFTSKSDVMEDAYQIAKKFESEGFFIDKGFVDFIDENVYPTYSDIEKEEWGMWVEYNNIQLKFKVGDKVVYEGKEMKIGTMSEWAIRRGYYELSTDIPHQYILALFEDVSEVTDEL